MIFPHFIAGVPSTADSQPMFGEKMREIPVTNILFRYLISIGKSTYYIVSNLLSATNLLNGIANLSLFLYPYLRNIFCNDDPPVLCVFANAYRSISDGLFYHNIGSIYVKKT